ncbi:hypothetical protein NLG97_g6363 [Lecanicillium saksenae]|uniref:Uncharacterized protein n=1 Tax=Lecanicillium saksenae TaxID=468837 RepID=A0ACC1QRI9_9HYPO|nr:hypothetical protein NLG97_g6363 [Lecanicillium saksenae]
MELILERASLEDDDVRKMAVAFPRLQRLTLKYGFSEYVDNTTAPAFFVGELARAYSGSLTFLSLDWSEAWNIWMEDWQDSGASLRAVAGLAALRELVLLSPEKHRRGQMEEAFWAELLPPGLERLAVTDFSGDRNAMPLVRAVQRCCGKLRAVAFSSERPPEDAAELQSMLATGSIGFDFKYKK